MSPAPKQPTSTSGRNRNLVIAIAAAALVAVVLIGASVLTRDRGKKASSPAAAAALVKGIPQNGTVLGNPAAKVRMLQFEDFQCPVCRQYTEEALPDILRQYVKPGKVKLDFRGLAFIGPDSDKALRIALAAGLQNKLWDVAELLYAEQGAENSGWVTDAKIDEILAQVPGLDAAKAKADANGPAVKAAMVSAQADAKVLSVRGTPSFALAIGKATPYTIQPGAFALSAFSPAFDDALKG
jgi:protein-disulfide isomerase